MFSVSTASSSSCNGLASVNSRYRRRRISSYTQTECLILLAVTVIGTRKLAILFLIRLQSNGIMAYTMSGEVDSRGITCIRALVIQLYAKVDRNL